MEGYKVCVYAIAKDEAKFAARWAESMSEADAVYVLDTGSSDDTVKILQAHGVNVRSEIITPWRFDTARNRSLELVPEDADICVCTDIDEVLHPGWRAAAEKAWSSGADMLRYRYTWNFNEDGSEGTVFYIDKIHARHGFKWVNPVHEVLEYKGEGSFRHIIAEGIQLDHLADASKSRAQYLPLLEMSVRENPENDRNMHYLGREYMFYGRWNDCIATLKRHIEMKSAVWRDERSASMRFIARACTALNDIAEAESWLYRAAAEAPYLREPWIELAGNAYARQDFEGTLYFALKALAIETRPKTYITEPAAWGAAPYDYASLGYFYTGRKKEALIMAEKAVEKEPENERLRANRDIIAQLSETL